MRYTGGKTKISRATQALRPRHLALNPHHTGAKDPKTRDTCPKTNTNRTTQEPRSTHLAPHRRQNQPLSRHTTDKTKIRNGAYVYIYIYIYIYICRATQGQG